MALSRARYRASQFFSALRPCVRPDDYLLALDLLPVPLLDRFLAMKPEDQQHSVAVCRLLMKSGCRDTDLLRASLLHDVGKGRPLLWHRVAYVLVRWARGRMGDRIAWTSAGGARWYRSLRNQDEAAAGMISTAGNWEPLARIVGGCPATMTEELHLLVLRAADDAC